MSIREMTDDDDEDGDDYCDNSKGVDAVEEATFEDQENDYDDDSDDEGDDQGRTSNGADSQCQRSDEGGFSARCVKIGHDFIEQ